MRRCSLCLLHAKEVLPFLMEVKKKDPRLQFTLSETPGSLHIDFQQGADLGLEEVIKRFPTFYYGEGTIEEALQRESIARKKSLALAESCTGGMAASKITALPDASKYFLGSIVAYSNGWKERFLQVSRTTLKQKGAVSKEAVTEMVEGLFHETDADFAAAISGIAGPSGGTRDKPVGTIYIAIGERGHKIDAGVIHAPQDRSQAIDLSTYLTFGALWRRLVHHTATFS